MEKCTNPEDIHRQFIICLLKKNLDGALALYHREALFVPGPNQEAVSGQDSLAIELTKFMQVAPRMELVDRSVYRTANTCFVAMRWKLKDAKNEEIFTGMDVITGNADGSWQFLIDNPYGV